MIASDHFPLEMAWTIEIDNRCKRPRNLAIMARHKLPSSQQRYHAVDEMMAQSIRAATESAAFTAHESTAAIHAPLG